MEGGNKNESKLIPIFMIAVALIGVFIYVSSPTPSPSPEPILTPEPTPPPSVAYVYLVLEAEGAGPLTPDFEIAEDASASNGEYIQIPEGVGWHPQRGSATYTIHIYSPGNYLIWGRKIATTDTDNSFFVQIDEGTEYLWTLALSDNWHWDAVNHWGNGGEFSPEIDPLIFTLSAGDHILKIRQREDGTKLDKLLITNDLSYIPSDVPIVTPETVEEWNGKGISFGRSGDYEKAIECFNKAIELNPNIAEFYNNRGNAYAGLELYEKAIDDFNKAIELNPNIAELYNNRGNAYANLERYEKAIDDFNKAIELNPNLDEPHNNREIALSKLKEQEVVTGYVAIFAAAGVLAVLYLLRKRNKPNR